MTRSFSARRAEFTKILGREMCVLVQGPAVSKEACACRRVHAADEHNAQSMTVSRLSCRTKWGVAQLGRRILRFGGWGPLVHPFARGRYRNFCVRKGAPWVTSDKRRLSGIDRRLAACPLFKRFAIGCCERL